jgi:Putative Actinobacterial Holin-X, holin superfamily III
MEKEQSKNTLESLFESASDYVETRVELTKLKATKKSSEIVSTLASKLILGGICFFVLMVLNIAVGLLLGELLGKSYYGFFVLAAFYSLVGIVLYVSREKWIKNPVANAMIQKLNE